MPTADFGGRALLYFTRHQHKNRPQPEAGNRNPDDVNDVPSREAGRPTPARAELVRKPLLPGRLLPPLAGGSIGSPTEPSDEVVRPRSSKMSLPPPWLSGTWSRNIVTQC